ncbi:unnamed protein product [Closterium sp. NIES-54]
MVTTTTPGGQRVSICTCTRTGHHMAALTCQPGSSLYTLATKPPQVAASAQVSASGSVASPCSCRLLSHQTLLWHHRLGHPSLPRLHGMHSRLLVSGLPRSPPPLPPSPAPPCLPCVEGRQRAAPRSSSFPPTTAPLQTLHMDDLLVLCLHSDRGGEFSSDLFQDFCRGEGILQSFTRPDSPQQNGIAERRIGLVMEVARTSMIHAAAPHFPWPFAVRYAAHQLNLEPGCAEPAGVEPGGVEPEGVEPGGAESEGAESGGAEPRGTASSGGPAGASPRLSPQQLREWFAQRTRLWSGAAGAGDIGAGGTVVAGPGGARTRGTGAAGTGSVGGAGAGGSGAGDPAEYGGARAGDAGAVGAGAGGTGAGGAGAGGAGAVDPGARGAGAGGTGAGGTGVGGGGAVDPGARGAVAGGAVSGGTGAGDTVRPRPYFVPLLQQVLGLPSSPILTPPLLYPPPDQSQPALLPASPLPAPSPYTV